MAVIPFKQLCPPLASRAQPPLELRNCLLADPPEKFLRGLAGGLTGGVR